MACCDYHVAKTYEAGTKTFYINDVMILPLPERMKLHAEFMCATITGLLPKLPLIDQTGEHGIKVPDKVVYNQEVMDSCRALADAALAAFEGRWGAERKADDERREASIKDMAQKNIESLRMMEESDAYQQARRRAMGIPY